MIQINLTDTGVHAELARLVNAFDNPQPALKSIGELVVEFTKTRFEVSQDPYGKPWAPNTDTTLRRMLHGNAKNFTKVKGRLSARGQLALSSKKPLIGESKSLSTQFFKPPQEGENWRLVGGDGVEVRTRQWPMPLCSSSAARRRTSPTCGEISRRGRFSLMRLGVCRQGWHIGFIRCWLTILPALSPEIRIAQEVFRLF
jgi:hypothetical protein